MPQVFHDAAGAMLGGKLVVFGGGSPTSVDAVQAFDPSTGKRRVAGTCRWRCQISPARRSDNTVYLVGG